MTQSKQVILEKFFGTIVKVVSKGTSDSYAVMVIHQFNKRNKRKYPFVKYITPKNGALIVSVGINKSKPKLVANYISKLMDSLFSDLFKHLIKQKMTVGLYEDLQQLGVDI